MRKDKGLKRNKYKNNLSTDYKSYIARCNSLSLEAITEEQFNTLLDGECRFCGSSPYIIQDNNPLCKRCFKWKGDMSDREFIKAVDKIAQHTAY